MSTKTSPEWKLRIVAQRTADHLKGVKDRSNPLTTTFGIAMDDKFLKLTMHWSDIDRLSCNELRDFLVKQMKS